MTDMKLPASHGTPFAPRALVPVAVGRTTVNLYAAIDPGMQVEERAHAYRINKTALASMLSTSEFNSTRWVNSLTWPRRSTACKMTGSDSSTTAGVTSAV
jgi:hypothetical protein